MLLAAPLAGYLAMPALARLLMVMAWNMSEPHKWRGYMQERPSDRFLLVLTMVPTVFADLTIAIGVGVSIGLALRLRRHNVGMEKGWTPPDRQVESLAMRLITCAKKPILSCIAENGQNAPATVA
jgi:SulP family sulfate permease